MGQKILENLIQAASGYFAPQMAAGAIGSLVPAAREFGALGQAGAIFPQGAELPREAGQLKEMVQTLTPTEKDYRAWKALSDWHAQNYDWPNVLKDKWGMLKYSGGS